jgi:hypothetical protein
VRLCFDNPDPLLPQPIHRVHQLVDLGIGNGDLVLEQDILKAPPGLSEEFHDGLSIRRQDP